MPRKGKKLCYHATEQLAGYVPQPGVRADDVKKICLPAAGTEFQIRRSWIAGNHPDIVFVFLGDRPERPDPIDTVIEVELK